MKRWEVIADNLSKAGWSWGCVSAIDSEGRTIWIADAHRGDGKRFVVRADEKLTAFLELERAVCIHLLTERPTIWIAHAHRNDGKGFVVREMKIDCPAKARAYEVPPDRRKSHVCNFETGAFLLLRLINPIMKRNLLIQWAATLCAAFVT